MNEGFDFNLGDPGDGVRVMPQPSLIAFDPSDPDILVAGGRAAGVFLSSDGGRSWSLLTDPHAPGASGIPHLPNPAFAHFDHDKPGQVRVYLGTGRGIWRVDLATADLSVTKTDAPDPVAVGENITYTIDVSNGGPDMAQNATWEETLPTGTRFQSLAAPAGWTCEHPALNASGAVSCQNPSMAPGTATFSLVVRVVPSVDPAAGVTNSVLVHAAAVDPNPADNTAVTTTAVYVPVAINIRPGAFPNAVNRNGQVSLAVLSTNAGEAGFPLAFDATTIDPLSVRFGPAALVLGGAGASEIHGVGHIQDAFELDEVTKDGDLDMVLHFRATDAGLTLATTEACVIGQFTAPGGATYTFFGCDSIKVVP
jgi:uncharacterized repeat protein (TIGR01451 family)